MGPRQDAELVVQTKTRSPTGWWTLFEARGLSEYNVAATTDMHKRSLVWLSRPATDRTFCCCRRGLRTQRGKRDARRDVCPGKGGGVPPCLSSLTNARKRLDECVSGSMSTPQREPRPDNIAFLLRRSTPARRQRQH